MQKLVVIMLVALSMVSTAWARGAYTWTDEDGVVHYSDRMRGDEASIINIHVREPETAPAPEKKQASENSTKSDTVAATASPQSAEEVKKIYKENCGKARKMLETNQQMTRMYRVVNGERHYLSDKERNDVIKRSRDAVSYWCH